MKKFNSLMRHGVPSVDIEDEHVSKLIVFKLGGEGAPAHMGDLSPDAGEADLKRFGHGEFIVKAVASSASGRNPGSFIAYTRFSVGAT